MKKIIFSIIALLIIFLVYKKDNYIVIPSNSIRIRVISNGDNFNDIKNKIKVKEKITNYLYEKLNNIDNIKDAENEINNNMETINKFIKDEGIDNYNINFGLNYFPKKIYKGVIYKEGNYNSLEIKLGEGIGENYWCVLFPPLCMINENKTTKDVNYKYYIKEIIDKYSK